MRYINDLIEKRAVKKYALKDFKTEFGLFTAFIVAAKLGVSMFSGYAGYYFCLNLFIGTLHSKTATIIAAIAALLGLEILTNSSLSLFFKFSFRHNLKYAITLILLSVFFYSGSFYVSTNGMEQREGKNVDDAANIIENYDLQASELKKRAENATLIEQNAIETIKESPGGYIGGERKALLKYQLNMIDKHFASITEISDTLRNDLNSLETRKADELNSNSSNVKTVSNKSYNAGVAIMIIQFILNGIVMFLYSKIYHDKEKEQMVKDKVKTFALDIADITDQLIEENVSKQYLSYMSALSFQLGDHNKKQSLPNLPKDNKSIGFKKTDDDPLNNASVGTDGTHQKTHGTHDVTNEIRSCKLCGTPFKPYNIKHVFCCTEHKLKWHKQNTGFDLDKFIKY